MIKSRSSKIYHRKPLRKNSNSRVKGSLILMMLTLFCVADVIAQDAPDISKTLSEEARRQRMVCQRMDDLIVEFQEIIVDLVSNELLAEAKGKELSDTMATLGRLNMENVPKAAKLLEDALIRLEMLQPNLDAADREIRTVLNELEKLINDSSIVSLISELEEIIQREKRLYSDTKEWKREISKAPQDARSKSGNFAEKQDQIASRVEDFQKSLEKSTQNAAADPLQGLNLQRAQDELKRRNPGRSLRRAAGEMGNANPDPAIQKQQAALVALEEVKRLLEQNEFDALEEAHKDFRDKLEELLEEQTKLRENTESASQNRSHQQKQDLLKQQRELGNRLNKMMNFELPPMSPPRLPGLLQNAHEKTEQAAQRMASNKKLPAVRSQREAEKHLQKAVDLMDRQLAAMRGDFPDMEDLAEKAEELARKQDDLRGQTNQTPNESLPRRTPQQNDLQKQAKDLSRQAPIPQFKQSSQQMQQASQALEQGQKQEATQHQQEAAKLMEEGAEILRAAQEMSRQDLEDLAQKARELSQKQDSLRAQTNQTPEKSLSQRTPEQDNLQEQAENLGQQAPIPQFEKSAQQMQQASESLQQDQKQEAMQNQREAAKSLEEGAKALMAAQDAMPPGPQQSLEDLMKKAQALSQKQDALQEQTGQTPGESLPQLTPQQDGLQQQAEDLAQEAPMSQFQESAQQMQQASEALQQGQGQQAMQHQQAAAQSLMEGTQALMNAQNAGKLMSQQQQLMNETAQAGQGSLPKLGQAQGNLGQQAQSMKFPQAAQQMAMAGQAMGKGQQGQAMQHQQNAMKSLMKQMNQKGMGKMTSAMRFRLFGKSALTAKPMPGAGMNEEAYRYFDRMPGEANPDGDANWESLPPRKLKAFYQNYAHELPAEYRKLLEEYYETLSE